MEIVVLLLLVVIRLLRLTLYAISREESRKVDRRKEGLAVAVERREKDRREGSVFAYLRWILGRLWSKITD